MVGNAKNTSPYVYNIWIEKLLNTGLCQLRYVKMKPVVRFKTKFYKMNTLSEEEFVDLYNEVITLKEKSRKTKRRYYESVDSGGISDYTVHKELNNDISIAVDTEVDDIIT